MALKLAHRPRRVIVLAHRARRILAGSGIVRFETTCPLCKRPYTSTVKNGGLRRNSYRFHLVYGHPELENRDRSLHADTMLRTERRIGSTA